MRITLTLPDRIAREAEKLARDVGASISEFCAHAVEEYVKAASQQQAIDMLNAMLASPTTGARGADDLLPERRA